MSTEQPPQDVYDFNTLIAGLEADSRHRAETAFCVEARTPPAFAQWIGRRALPPGHIALQGDFDRPSLDSHPK